MSAAPGRVERILQEGDFVDRVGHAEIDPMYEYRNKVFWAPSPSRDRRCAPSSNGQSAMRTMPDIGSTSTSAPSGMAVVAPEAPMIAGRPNSRATIAA